VQIATKPTWAFQDVPSEGSNLARLGELGGKLLPHFPINRGRMEEEKHSTLLVSEDHLKLVKKNCFCEENPHRGTSVTHPKHFHG